jgi:integrase
MSKRHNGEGTVRQRPNGTWEARLSYLDPLTDKRRRASFYGPTAENVRDQLKEARDRLDAADPVKDSVQRFGEYLEHWLDSALEASSRKQSTKVLYRNLSKHLTPLQAKPLAKIRKTDIDALIVGLRKKGLSDSSVRSIYTVLRAVLEDAKTDGLVAVNMATKVPRPGIARKEAKHLTVVDVIAVLAASEGLRYSPVLKLIAATGLRRGEAIGLYWTDVNLDTGELRVRHTLSRVDGELLITEPKTARSRRTIPLPPPVVKLLKAQRAAQAADKLKAGDQWTDTGLVFTNEFGGPVDPRNMLRTIELASKKAEIEGVGVHTLRHSAAVAWLEQGIHIKAVADLLGHGSISVTGDIYGHSSDETTKAAIDGLTSQLGL